VNITVQPAIQLDIRKSGPNAILSWRGHGSNDTLILERVSSLPATSWTPVLTNGSNAIVPAAAAQQFFRIRKQ
jgi:hypothetical protein